MNYTQTKKHTFITLILIITIILIPSLFITPMASAQDQTPEPEPTSMPLSDHDESSESSDNLSLGITQSPEASTSDSVIEVLTIPSDGSYVSTSFALASDTVYTIRASGTYVWGECDPYYCPNGGPDYLRYGDAEYLTDDHWQSFSDPGWLEFIYLEVNGTNPYFGPYNQDHVYSISIQGNGSPATFRIHDCSHCYGDNSGYLTVEVIGEQTEPWWAGVLRVIASIAKRLGMTVVEFVARIKNLGPAWEGLIAGWQIYKASELGDKFNNPDYRARLIDEAYYGYDGENVRFRSRVDDGVELGCVFIGCNASSWNELSYEDKRNEEMWTTVCASVGGGFCSGFLLPQFMLRWLQ